MKWTKEAEKEISRVPFFIRRRVRKRIEEEAEKAGTTFVNMEHVHYLKEKYMKRMEDEIKGYEVETCMGRGRCPNKAANPDELARELDDLLANYKIKKFLKKKIKGPLKFHHEFRISISDCPNACSRPQITDVGLIGASKAEVTGEECSHCMACVEVCREGAIEFYSNNNPPVIYPEKCLSCGQCMRACAMDVIQEEENGYRVLLGGKLGRHPQLGRELGGIYSPAQCKELIKQCVEHFLNHYKESERFGDIINRTSTDFLKNMKPSKK